MAETLERLIAEDGITAVARFVAPPPGSVDDHWRVTLACARTGQSMTVPFSTGPALRAEMVDGPSAADVLECLLSDAAGWLNADGFDDWARDYGMDFEYGGGAHMQARRTYDNIRAQVDGLRLLLGELFEDYVWETTKES